MAPARPPDCGPKSVICNPNAIWVLNLVAQGTKLSRHVKNDAQHAKINDFRALPPPKIRPKNMLNRSLNKSGISNHIFEEICDIFNTQTLDFVAMASVS